MNEERIRRLMAEDREREERLKEWATRKSPCLKGRLRHQFRSPQTRSLTPDLKCWWCGKTVAEVRAEREQKRRAAEMLETLAALKKEEEMILQEVRDHAAYWQSDMAKRVTVEKHLFIKGMVDAHSKIDRLIRTGKLLLIPKPRGDYLKERTEA